MNFRTNLALQKESCWSSSVDPRICLEESGKGRLVLRDIERPDLNETASVKIPLWWNISNVQDQIWGISCKSKLKNHKYMAPKSGNNILASIYPIQTIQLLWGLLSYNLSQPFNFGAPSVGSGSVCSCSSSLSSCTLYRHQQNLVHFKRVLGSWVIGVVLKVQHVQHLGW